MKTTFRTTRIALFILLGICISCQQRSETDKDVENSTIKPLSDTTLVTTARVKLGNFSSETWSNGTIEAGQKAIVALPAQGNLVSLPVKNGQQVSVGQVLAQLDNSRQMQELKQAQLTFEKAALDFEDQLLRLGYSLKDTATLATGTLEMIKLRSGIKDAELQLKKARYEMSLTTIKAPISGIIIGMVAQNHSPSSEYKNLCTILNNRTMKISFMLLESDAAIVKLGMIVKVFPIALPGKVFYGRVSEIEPIIDNNGRLKVVAEVQSHNGQLLDGMHVRVVTETAIANQLIIPKLAVLARQGRQVVFTVENGHAIWNYVTTGYENSTEFTITEGLTEGQTIITSNNLTIGHEAPVRTDK